MSAETWRVVLDDGKICNVMVRHDGPGWCVARYHLFDVGDVTPRAAIARFCAAGVWSVVEILAPGQPSRAEVENALAEAHAREASFVAHIEASDAGALRDRAEIARLRAEIEAAAFIVRGRGVAK